MYLRKFLHNSNLQTTFTPVTILFIVGLLFVPIYWITDVAFIGVIGYTALCLANGYNLFYALVDIKKENKQTEGNDNSDSDVT